MKHIATLYGQNLELMNVKTGGTYYVTLCLKELKVNLIVYFSSNKIVHGGRGV
jgi:hypothetical protein